MNCNLEGYHVSGIYLEKNYVNGTVIESKSSYGGIVRHILLLDRPMTLCGVKKTHAILNHSDITNIDRLIGKNQE